MNRTGQVDRLQPWDIETLRQVFAGVDLPYEDGEPLESDWHLLQMHLLIELVYERFAGQSDFFAGGNMFLYFNPDQLKNKDFRGPDFFFVRGRTTETPRKYWAVWDEDGRYPNVIVELTSTTTEHVDRAEKYDIYERVFRTPEYFICDPEAEKLDGYRLDGEGHYRPIPSAEDGRQWSEQLGMWLGRWQGRYRQRQTTWLRFFTVEGVLVPMSAERADTERQRADAERQRADAAEVELSRLRALLGTMPTKNGH